MNKEEILDRIYEIQKELSKLSNCVHMLDEDEEGHIDKFTNVRKLNPNNLEDVFTHVWEDLEKNFDFEKVQKMMNAVNWKWAFIKGPLTLNIIKENVKEMVHEVLERKTTISTGGFEYVYRTPQNAAECFGCEAERGIWPTVELKFVGESWETDFGYDETINE